MPHEALLLPASILFSSFLGSWHCAGMCGPFAALTGSRGKLWHYHLGRLLIYFSLGGLSGYFGKIILDTQLAGIRSTGAIIFALILISMGLQYLFKKDSAQRSHAMAGNFFASIYRRLYKFKVSRSSFTLGLMTGLLPCVWLYTYVLAAAATRSPWSGGLVMLLFWLGGLPALSTVAVMIRAPLKTTQKNKQRISGLVLVFAGLYALLSHLFMHAL